MLAAAMAGLFFFLIAIAVGLGLWMSAGAAPEVKRPSVAVLPSRFFAEGARGADAKEVPVDVFLSQLESHIRLEHAAAENFLYAPDVKSLHAPTTSPLSN